MRYLLTITVSIMVAGFVVGAAGRTFQTDKPEPRKIELSAKKYEFTPSRLEVKVGEPIELTATSADAKHGFECKDLGIQKVTFEKGKPAVIAFTANKAGTYEFKCANFCGFGHGKMKGQIVVVP